MINTMGTELLSIGKIIVTAGLTMVAAGSKTVVIRSVFVETGTITFFLH